MNNSILFKMERKSDFINYLHEEKLQIMGERNKYTIFKITIIITILGISSSGFFWTEHKPIDINPEYVAMLIPLIAIGLDLYINGADSGIKRIGVFVRSQENKNTFSTLETDWEKCVVNNRFSYPKTANCIFSIISILASIGLLLSVKQPNFLFILFLEYSIVMVFLIHLHHYFQIIEMDKKTIATRSNGSRCGRLRQNGMRQRNG